MAESSGTSVFTRMGEQATKRRQTSEQITRNSFATRREI
jgi:hypothetical protein